MMWTERILRERDRLEVLTGYTPSHVVLKNEVWSEISFEETGEFVDIWEIGGMNVSVSETIDAPFELLIKLSALENG